MPTASISTATAVKPGFLASVRKAKPISRSQDSIIMGLPCQRIIRSAETTFVTQLSVVHRGEPEPSVYAHRAETKLPSDRSGSLVAVPIFLRGRVRVEGDWLAGCSRHSSHERHSETPIAETGKKSSRLHVREARFHGQFSVGLSTWSTTRVSIDAFVDCSFSPSCSCRAT